MKGLIFMKFNEKLQNLRKEKNMSQEDLAAKLNVTRQSVSKWESGLAYPEMEKLIVLSELFGVSLDDLIKENKNLQEEPQTRYHHYQKTYQYTSKRIVFGLPLVHVSVGYKMKKAKGIIAVGNNATGIIALGLFSKGVISLGILSLGGLSFGVLGIGLLASLGAIAIAPLAMGAIAFGIYSIGGIAIGMYSLGAVAIGSHIAIGDYAQATIAIGKNPHGTHVIKVKEVGDAFSLVTKTQIQQLVNKEFSGLGKSLSSIVISLFK